MGGLFSSRGPPGEGSHVDPQSALDVPAASGAASATDETISASLTEPSVSARQNSVGSLSSVTDAARDSDGEGPAPAEVPQST